MNFVGHLQQFDAEFAGTVSAEDEGLFYVCSFGGTAYEQAIAVSLFSQASVCFVHIVDYLSFIEIDYQGLVDE